MLKKSKHEVRVSPKNQAKRPLEGQVLRVFPDGKTARVRVGYTLTHARYKKVLRRYTDYLVHLCRSVQEGESVQIYPCRRVSKKKSWVVQG